MNTPSPAQRPFSPLAAFSFLIPLLTFGSQQSGSSSSLKSATGPVHGGGRGGRKRPATPRGQVAGLTTKELPYEAWRAVLDGSKNGSPHPPAKLEKFLKRPQLGSVIYTVLESSSRVNQRPRPLSGLPNTTTQCLFMSYVPLMETSDREERICLIITVSST